MQYISTLQTGILRDSVVKAGSNILVTLAGHMGRNANKSDA
jgi:hypothetical protein